MIRIPLRQFGVAPYTLADGEIIGPTNRMRENTEFWVPKEVPLIMVLDFDFVSRDFGYRVYREKDSQYYPHRFSDRYKTRDEAFLAGREIVRARKPDTKVLDLVYTERGERLKAYHRRLQPVSPNDRVVSGEAVDASSILNLFGVQLSHGTIIRLTMEIDPKEPPP